MMLKKIAFLACMVLACSDNEAPKPPVVEEEVFTQYGVPFGGVPDARDVVLYEVNIRAYSESGDLQGVIDRLDHIQALGVNTIWLMPIHPVGRVKSAGGLGSPYAVQDYRNVNPEFGDLAKLRELVDEAHERNIAVIMDWVANHTSWDNSWMSNPSWYTKDEAGNIISPPGTNWQDVAELNYDNFDMREAMINAMKYWVLEANVDGYRCDAVEFVPLDFWQQALTELNSIPGRKLIFLGEGGKAENFAAGFQMNYAFDFYNNIRQVYSAGRSAKTIFATHEAEYNNIPAGAVKLRYTTNHDLSAWEATPVEALGGESAALSASVITIFTSAAPLIYSSQEVARVEKLSFFDSDPINWNDNQEILDAYEKLFSVYHETDAFTEGGLSYFDDDDIAIFTRTHESDQYLVMVNVRNAEQSWAVDAALKNTQWTDKVNGGSMVLGETIALPPFGYFILKKTE